VRFKKAFLVVNLSSSGRNKMQPSSAAVYAVVEGRRVAEETVGTRANRKGRRRSR